MRTKICTKCGLEKPTSEFNKNKLKKDGLQSECRDCHKQMCSSYYQRNKTNYRKTSKLKRQKILSIVNNIKSKGCIICGETNIACLDFHHLRDKKGNISDLIKIENLNKVINEINKCIVLCANCHRKLHNQSFETIIAEGNLLGRQLS